MRTPTYALLLRAAVLAAVSVSVAPVRASTWQVASGGLSLQVNSTYSYELMDSSTQQVLLSEDALSFVVGGTTYSAQSLSNVTVGTDTIAGTLNLVNGANSTTAQVVFTLANNTVDVNLTRPGLTAASSVSESFQDTGQHVYGIWETAYGTGLDNRGVSQDYSGQETTTTAGVFGSSARAPFYLMSNNIGVYTETQALGHYAIAVNGQNTQTFDSPSLHYQVYAGSSPKNVLSMYNAAAGAARLPPLWAFDSIWWRDDAHAIPTGSSATNAQSLVIEDATKLQNCNGYYIPASAIWLDRPYGSDTNDVDPNVQGWGNMDFDTSAAGFPNPSAMVQTLASKGLKTMLWVANKANNNLYTQASADGYLFQSPPTGLNLTQPGAAAFFQNELTTLMDAATLADGQTGIAGFKIDRGGEGEIPLALINQETTLFQQVAYNAMQAANGNDFFMFARNINDTGRQYAAVWSGDAATTFQGLQTSVMNGIRAGLINFPIWGSDCGGYSGSAPSKELFARWLGFGAYSPMMEVEQMPGRTIWFDYDKTTLPAGQKTLVQIASIDCQTHHDLIPYVYSCAEQAVQNGAPIMRALFLEFPNDANAYNATNLNTEYMYGSNLLVAPILTAGTSSNYTNSRSVYLPAGTRWLDYNNRLTRYNGGQTITTAATLDVVPVYVREGAIIPRGDILQSNNPAPNWAPYLRIEFFPSNFHSSFDYYTGSITQTITSDPTSDGFHLAFGDLGLGGYLDVYVASVGTVWLDGVQLGASAYTYNPTTDLLHVAFPGGPTTMDLHGASSIWAITRTWIGGSVANGNWSNTANWNGAGVQASTYGTLNTDIELFNTAIANTWGLASTPVVIDSAGQNIGGINFDTAAGSYFIGSTGGNSLLPAGGGAIQILGTLTAAHTTETINAPIILQGSYSFTNNSPRTSVLLDFGGVITNAAGVVCTLTLNGANAGVNTISGVMSNGGSGGTLSVTKSGLGTWVLTGANSDTGNTTVLGGTLTVGGAGGALSSSSALVVGGCGTFNFSTTGTHTQTVNGLTVSPGFGTVNNNVATDTLILGAITRAGGDGMVDFATTAGPIQTTGVGGAGNSHGIIAPWAYMGSDTTLSYAVGNGAGNAITGLSGQTALPTTGGTATTNYRITANTTLGAAESAYTLQVPNAVVAGVSITTSATHTLTLTGLLNSAGTGGSLIIAPATGKVFVGSSRELDVAINATAVTINSIIADNSGGASSVVFGSTNGGTLVLGGANTFSGGLVVNSGTLQANVDKAQGAGPITLQGTATLLFGFNGTYSTSNTITVTGDNTGVVTLGQNVSSNAPVFNGAIVLGNHDLTVASLGSNPSYGGGITGNGNLTISSSATGASSLTFQTNPINMAGTITNSGSGAGGVAISATIGGNVTGVAQSSATSWLTLSGVNSYTGGTTVSAGKLLIAGTNAFPTNSNLILSGTGTLQVQENLGALLQVSILAMTAAGGGTLNLMNNDAVVQTTDGDSLVSLLEHGNITTTSTAGAGAATPRIGYMTYADWTRFHGPSATFGGGAYIPQSTDNLLMYTYAGDASFDGLVDLRDYLLMDATYLQGYDGVTKVATWADGDFNYDGMVDYRDYALADAALDNQGSPLADQMIALHTVEFGQSYRSAFDAAVPEPTSLMLLGSGVIGALVRRRHRYHPTRGGD